MASSKGTAINRTENNRLMAVGRSCSGRLISSVHLHGCLQLWEALIRPDEWQRPFWEIHTPFPMSIVKSSGGKRSKRANIHESWRNSSWRPRIHHPPLLFDNESCKYQAASPLANRQYNRIIKLQLCLVQNNSKIRVVWCELSFNF